MDSFRIYTNIEYGSEQVEFSDYFKNLKDELNKDSLKKIEKEI